MKEYIEKVEERCNLYSEKIDQQTDKSTDQKSKDSFQSLKTRKEEIFKNLNKKLLFYRASLLIFPYIFSRKTEIEKLDEDMKTLYAETG